MPREPPPADHQQDRGDVSGCQHKLGATTPLRLIGPQWRHWTASDILVFIQHMMCHGPVALTPWRVGLLLSLLP